MTEGRGSTADEQFAGFLAGVEPWKAYVMQAHQILLERADTLSTQVAALEARQAPASPASPAPRTAPVPRPGPVYDHGTTTVGIGVTTFNRPEYARRSVEAILTHCAGLATVYVYDDGSAPQHRAAYDTLFTELDARGVQVLRAAHNGGVAVAKNTLMKQMLADGHDWLFLCEDDIVVRDSRAVTGYIDACVGAGVHHLSFAHHGPMNAQGPRRWTQRLAWYHHSIGAWTLFTRTCLDAVGYFDTGFNNAWEHVEHELRLIADGWCGDAEAWCFADARGSQEWITEIPGSLEDSSIRVDPEWNAKMSAGAQHWQATWPDSFARIFGEQAAVPEETLQRWRAQSHGAWGPAPKGTW